MKWVVAKIGTMSQSRVLHVSGKLKVGSKIKWSETGDYFYALKDRATPGRYCRSRYWVGGLREGTVMAIESWGLVRIDL